jgi:adenylate cyclase
MNLALKNRKNLKVIFALWSVLLLGVSAYLFIQGSVWTTYDFNLLDYFYRHAVRYGYGPKQSKKIVLVPITDNTYQYFGKNFLDRNDLAKVNDVLAKLNVQAVAYDIIFALPSNKDSDDRFRTSVSNLGRVYLPIGLQYSPREQPFKADAGKDYSKLFSEYLRKPHEQGNSSPFYGMKGLLQYDAFAHAAFNSGHISDYSDPDGIHRHMIMLLKVNGRYLPTLSLSMFLDYVGVPFERVTVAWDHGLIIPALEGSVLEKDVVIPIDNRGRAFIPFTQLWNKSFEMIEAQRLLGLINDETLSGNLTEFFEGKFVFIGDISTGAGDSGNSPLESNLPLIITHASMLNAMLTHTFYSKWSFWQVIGVIWLMGILIGLSAFFRFWWMLYTTGFALLAAALALTWFQLIQFTLIPVFTIGTSFLLIFAGLICGLEVFVGRERTLIRNIFSKYVPQKIVDQLLEKPELLNLGGEERVVTVLFADLKNFTTMAEKMPPTELVLLLNDYLGEMTKIIFSYGGIIDKYIGDSIMAEYGVPLPIPDHADRAVQTALKMQERLKELRDSWINQGRPVLNCCIGINTGPVIVGNMGSHEILDYTVIGDSVNLASRLEGVNRYYDTNILISEYTHRHVTPGKFKTRMVDIIKVKGKSEAVRIYEVYGDDSSILGPDDAAYYASYQEGFEAYLNRRFDVATGKFHEALLLRPEDRASRTMIERICGIKPDNISADWDGSFLFTTK